MSVCVVGAGIIGLPTAAAIQAAEPRAKVTLIAEDSSPNLVSDVAAGFWRPIFIRDPRKELINKWGEETMQMIQQLANENPTLNGASMVSGYEFLDHPPTVDEYYWQNVVKHFRTLTESEITNVGVKGYKHGVFYSSVMLEPKQYLPRVLERFKQNGGCVQKQRLRNLDQVGSGFDVIVNCSGLNAFHLVKDRQCYPIRGQILRVEAPHVHHFMEFDVEGLYVLPNQQSVVLGGTHQDGDWNTNVSREDSERILTGLNYHLPWISKAKVLREVVGLRPGRPTIRVEAEMGAVQGRPTAIVHNYGHGGSGVTLHHGCALHAATLARHALHRPSSAAKL